MAVLYCFLNKEVRGEVWDQVCSWGQRDHRLPGLTRAGGGALHIHLRLLAVVTTMLGAGPLRWSALGWFSGSTR